MTDQLTPQRVRHPLRFRLLEVCQVQRLSPHLVRITLGGDALDGFVSLGFDDHIKLFFPDPATGEVAVPQMGDGGPVWPDGVRPVMRDYTPRHVDLAARTLSIDFALHHPAGPATRWAEQAQVGQRLGVGGPKGSFIVPTGFDAHLLVGDDTGLPAIARRLEELPASSSATVLIEVDGPDDRIPLPSSAASVHVQWVYRCPPPPMPGQATNGEHEGAEDIYPLLHALRQTRLPAGTLHAWVACESAQAKALRAHLLTQCQLNPQWVRASAYWRRGSADAHESLDR